MKTLLIIDPGLGQARCYLAKTLLTAAAPKAHLEIIDNPNDAEMAIVVGNAVAPDTALNGKKVFLGNIDKAVQHPELFVGEAKEKAEDINEMFRDEEVKAIFCISGGFNSNVVFEYLNYDFIRNHPKIIFVRKLQYILHFKIIITHHNKVYL